MSLLPDTASFEEMVQDCFLAYRGSGVMVSPLDAELIEAWAAAGMPFEVVARGLRRAAETAMWDATPGLPLLRSLRACRRHVDAELKRFRSQGPAQATDAARRPRRRAGGPWKARLEEIEKLHPHLAPRARALLSRGRPESPEEATREDERVAALLLRGLPFAQRLSVLREARAFFAQSTVLSFAGRRLARRFHRAAALCRALGLSP